MAKLNDLKRYLNYQFSSGGTTGKDYLSFQTKYLNYIKGLCNENGWEFVKASKMHYEFSCFIKKDNKFIYMSIPDVRFFVNGWYDDILVRTAEHDKDYHGGMNNRATLDTLATTISRVFEWSRVA